MRISYTAVSECGSGARPVDPRLQWLTMRRRDALIDGMTESINAYISSQEASVGAICRIPLRSVEIQEITQQLLLMALVLGLGLWNR
ncbi:MAG: hypothetical protein R3B83_10240 [Nitrospirales bacterium]|nr:hypothetical protein [Nitrospirales bacterium]